MNKKLKKKEVTNFFFKSKIRKNFFPIKKIKKKIKKNFLKFKKTKKKFKMKIKKKINILD